MRYLHENGLRRSVTGFGDTEIASDLNLTSVSQSYNLIAENIFRILLQLLRCAAPSHLENIVASSPVIRGSVARF